MFALYIIFRKKIVLSKKTQGVVQSVVLFAVITVMGVIYILPVILNLSSY